MAKVILKLHFKRNSSTRYFLLFTFYIEFREDGNVLSKQTNAASKTVLRNRELSDRFKCSIAIASVPA
jgi:hypothetical protein